ncbi:MAG: hypothetical protein ACREE3_16300, partial [Stellaceae bacterium]
CQLDAPARIELTLTQLDPLDPDTDEAAAAYVSTHQTALMRLTTYLEEEGFNEAMRGYSWLARGIESFKTLAARLLDHAYGINRGLFVSITEPDRLARKKDVRPRDTVAEFLMRKKRYAVVGLQTRLRQSDLSVAQRQHSLQTLALVTGRKFHREPAADRDKNAVAWLDHHLR